MFQSGRLPKANPLPRMRYLGTNLRAHLAKKVEDQDLRRLIYEISSCARYISMAIKDAERGLAGTSNRYGEQQLQLDVLADTILLERFRSSMLVRQFASEESEDIVTFSHLQGKYAVTVDPLDGSSLVDVNLSLGTIVGIHQAEQITEPGTLVGAMYISYGPLTTLMYAAEKSGVHEFVLNPAGEFILSKEDIMVAERGNIYSPGGLETEWTDSHIAFIKQLRDEGYKLRYAGAMVADINQILIKGGGIFTYPALKSSPLGKLRLLFEAQPMAYIMVEAGGAASDGTTPLLAIHPNKADERTPVYIGSKYEVGLATKYLSSAGKSGK